MDKTYRMAYTEVCSILNCLPDSELNKIPKEKIDFYENNRDKEYKYFFDGTKPLSEQKISKEANAVIVVLFRDYFATLVQQKKLQSILEKKDQEKNEKIKEKYNSENIFNKRKKENNSTVAMTNYKESLFNKILNKIRKCLISIIR